MAYIGFVLPYENRVINVQEVVNEWTVIVASYHLFCFTEWIYDNDRRIECGWSLLVVIALNILFNVCLILVFAVKSLYLRIKKRIALRNYNKMTPQQRYQYRQTKQEKALVSQQLQEIREEAEDEAEAEADDKSESEQKNSQELDVMESIELESNAQK